MTAAEDLRRVPNAQTLGLVGILVLAAALRFFDLDRRSYWRDEAITVQLVRRSLGGMLSAIPDSEGTPPLYYVLAWAWTQVTGPGEAGLRSLSALLGTATVAVVYAIGSELASRRIALAAAALAAVNPFLVWQAQDGRSYALYTLLGGISFLACVRAMRSPTTPALAAWTVASALAVWTHYFAVFLVVPEALLLLAVPSRRPAKALATAALAAAGAALIPLALYQRTHARVAWISEIPYANRMRELVREFLVGPQPPHRTAVVLVSAISVLGALGLLWRRGTEQERRAALVAGGTGAAALALALVVSLAGTDYFLSRNVVVTWVPFAVTVAAGLAGRRAGVQGAVLLAVLCVSGTGVVIASADEPKFGGEDWRGAARALGAPGAPRAVVLWLGAGEDAFRIYRTSARALSQQGAIVEEVDVVVVGIQGEAVQRRLQDLEPRSPFEEVDRVAGDHFTVVRYRADRPIRVRPSTIGSGPAAYSASVLIDQR